MKGVFSKKEPKDLFAKLQKDFDRLKENQLDEDAALDFFITAESLTDWFFPGRMNKEQQMLHRNSSILLQIVSHIASSAYSTVILPPIPRAFCHPVHEHPATDSTMILPPLSGSDAR